MWPAARPSSAHRDSVPSFYSSDVSYIRVLSGHEQQANKFVRHVAKVPARVGVERTVRASSSWQRQPVISLPEDDLSSWAWQGQDQFTPLDDRKDLPPVPLPQLDCRKRVVLVRHGQSTWNGRSRMQGSSDFSVLTDQGIKQARAAAKLLRPFAYDVLFHSPLKRAEQTADIVWRETREEGAAAPRVTLPFLREIDLYSFQGLEKVEAKFRLGEVYRNWQADPANCEIDGHAPVRELWYRASLAWQEILGAKGALVGRRRGVVVGHNAANQALLCTALGLPPRCFRKFTQTNAGVTVLELYPREGGEGQEVAVEWLNQLPELPLNPEKLGRPTVSRLILVAGPAGSPGVKSSLELLTSYGVKSAPLIAIGSPQAQAQDVCTALEAALLTPGGARAVVAVADPPAIQHLLGMWVGEVAGEGGVQRGGGDGRGAVFRIDPGSFTILNFATGVASLGKGVVLCSNFSPAGLPPEEEEGQQ